MVNEITCFFNASVLYYEMLLRFDGRNQKRIAMISFFVQQFRTKVIFMKMRFCEWGSGWILQKGGGFYEVYTEEF